MTKWHHERQKRWMTIVTSVVVSRIKHVILQNRSWLYWRECMRTQCVYTFVFAFLCFLHQANNNSILTFITVVVARSFFSTQKLLMWKGPRERKKERRKRERSCSLIINLFAFVHNDKYCKTLDEHYLIARMKEIQNSILIIW